MITTGVTTKPRNYNKFKFTTPNEQTKLDELLEEYEKIFRLEPGLIKTSEPINQPPYPILIMIS